MRVSFDYQGHAVCGVVVQYYPDDTVMVDLDSIYVGKFDDSFVFVPASSIFEICREPQDLERQSEPKAGEKRKLEDPESENEFKKRKIDTGGK